jgi:hypothetical protein
MRNFAPAVAVLALVCLSAACSAPTANTSNTATTNATASKTAPAATPAAAARAGSLGDPKGSIAYQFELVKAGDADKLKQCVTPRLRDSVTQEVVDKAKGNAAQYSMDDLYASAEMGEADGKKTAKVKMKNGRTLTTLVETNGQWLSDTVWFK